jgi:uncharacterized LabA/DUF88 family protein
MKKVAFLIDGHFLFQVYRSKKKKIMTENDVIPIVKKALKDDEEIFRVYYDAPPFDRPLTNPIDGSIKDYSQSRLYASATNFQKNLAEKEFIAFRSGMLSFAGWRLTDALFDKLKSGNFSSLVSTDVAPDFKQKGVDIKIGLDIANLATKRIVDKIMLITSDQDFIPAMKFARREGLRIAIVKIDDSLSSMMKQHCDEVIDIDLKKI